ncbi:MAG TPA: hypothetical protein VM243_07125 [Phycisphaerae bacterium]|nr:hypothetical protein [Phycisphaerae bacterium]
MLRSIRRRCWWKLAAAVLACGSLFQTGACNQTLTDLAQSWAISVADQYIGLYFTEQFNVASSPF